MEHVGEYGARFGHGVPQGVMLTLSVEEILALVEKALETGEPVPGWTAGDEFSISPRRAELPLVGMSEMEVDFAAGACRLIALREALTGSGWTWVAGWLAASLAAHVADLRARSLH